MIATIIIPIADRDIANTIAHNLDTDVNGIATFNNVRLSANGLEPATHLACNSWVSPASAAKFPGFKLTIPNAVYMFDGDPKWFISQNLLVRIQPPEPTLLTHIWNAIKGIWQ